MDEFAGIAVGRHEAEPAPGDEAVRVQAEHAVGDRSAVVMVVEEPAVDPGPPQRSLDSLDLHGPSYGNPAHPVCVQTGPSLPVSGCIQKEHLQTRRLRAGAQGVPFVGCLLFLYASSR